MKNEIIEVLMRRDGMTQAEAKKLLRELRSMIEEGADPEDILYEELGLEPDYIFDLVEI
jgi:predicted nucleic acid-binding protein